MRRTMKNNNTFIITENRIKDAYIYKEKMND